MFRKLFVTLVFLLCLSHSFHAQDTVPHRLFPGMGQKQPKLSKEELKAQIDSLNALVISLQKELGVKDSLHAEMSARIDEVESRKNERPELEYTHEMTDSLIHVYYVNRQMSEFQDIQEVSTYMNDSMRFTTNVPDSVLFERMRLMNSYITLPFNATVRNYMVLYSEKNLAKMRTILSKASYYFPIFEEVFNRYDLPDELKYMSVIESALIPTARSRAGARGLWQFMHVTGKQYGLRINSYVDERMDVEKSADAAARYLLDSYKLFGDWTLAISSYNCGVGNVNKAIKRSGRRDFWSIYPYLPRETRGYMPAFVGAMYAMTYYKEYGIVPDPPLMPAQTDTFHIHRNLHFQQINELVGVPMETIRELNPQYLHDIVPGNEGEYVLKLPFEYTNTFIEVQDTIYSHRADTLLSTNILKSIEDGVSGNSEMIRYKVKSGDYLGKIAGRYHVSVAQIKKWNHLKNNNLRVGQMLTIYRNGIVPAPKPAAKPAPTPAPAPAGTSVAADVPAAAATVSPASEASRAAESSPGSVSPHNESDTALTVISVADTAAREAGLPADSVAATVLQTAVPTLTAGVNTDSTALPKKRIVTELPEQKTVADSKDTVDKKDSTVTTESSETTEEYLTHRVTKGESLFSISRRYGITVSELQSINGISGSKITIGMELKVPKKD